MFTSRSYKLNCKGRYSETGGRARGSVGLRSKRRPLQARELAAQAKYCHKFARRAHLEIGKSLAALNVYTQLDNCYAGCHDLLRCPSQPQTIAAIRITRSIWSARRRSWRVTCPTRGPLLGPHRDPVDLCSPSDGPEKHDYGRDQPSTT
jgi:hypothetical protein